MLERKRRQFNENTTSDNPHGESQCDTSISENRTMKSINKSTMVAQGPADDDDKTSCAKHGQWTCC